jgi:hypothetical protein
MALARCERCGLPKGSPETYKDWHLPFNCSGIGVRNCAFIWLTASEQERYIAGHRIFRYSSHSSPGQL